MAKTQVMTDETHQISRALAAHTLFKNARPELLTTLSQRAHIQKAPKGKILFVNRDKADHFFLILKGWVKLYRETLDGTQAVVDILPAGHIFGETSLFENGLYSYSAEAVEPLEYSAFSLSTLRAEIEQNPSFALQMLSSMAHYRKQQDQELEHLTLQNAPQRIGCFLLRLTDQTQKGAITIHLPYDKTLVASRLGMQPETFSRALSKLKDATGIKIKGATVELDSLEQLSHFSCSACSSEFPCKDLRTPKTAYSG